MAVAVPAAASGREHASADAPAVTRTTTAKPASAAAARLLDVTLASTSMAATAFTSTAPATQAAPAASTKLSSAATRMPHTSSATLGKPITGPTPPAVAAAPTLKLVTHTSRTELSRSASGTAPGHVAPRLANPPTGLKGDGIKLRDPHHAAPAAATKRGMFEEGGIAGPLGSPPPRNPITIPTKADAGAQHAQ